MTAIGYSTSDSWTREELEPVATCPVCDSAVRTTLYEKLPDLQGGTRGRWTLRRCRDCGAGYLDPRPKDDVIERAYAHYFTHEAPADPAAPAGPITALWRAFRNGYLNAALGYRLRPAAPLASLVLAPFPARRRMARKFVCDLPCPPGGGRLLDVGCGNGRSLLTMRWAGWRVEGVEPDTGAVATARRQGLTVHCGTLADVVLPRSSFEAITLEHVIEHVAAPVELLSRCRTLLRDDGVLSLATPNLDAPGHAAYRANWIGLDPPRHLVLLNAASLSRVLEAAGFEVVFLQPPRSEWYLRESEALARPNLTAALKARLAVRARAEDFRAKRDPAAGEELVVLARPRRG